MCPFTSEWGKKGTKRGRNVLTLAPAGPGGPRGPIGPCQWKRDKVSHCTAMADMQMTDWYVWVCVCVCVIPWVQAQPWQEMICHHSHETSEGRNSGGKQGQVFINPAVTHYRLKISDTLTLDSKWDFTYTKSYSNHFLLPKLLMKIF